MTRNEAVDLLKRRRELTGESFNDGTVDAWADALKPWTLDQCRQALTVVARSNARVVVGALVERLPALNRGRLFLVGSGYIDRDAQRRPAEPIPDRHAELVKLRETLRRVRGR